VAEGRITPASLDFGSDGGVAILQNGLHQFAFAIFRRVLDAAAGASMLAAFEADLATRRLLVNAANLTSVVHEAKRLSAAHTVMAGHRSFDILHIAAAALLAAKLFLSFDTNQRALAQAAGLTAMP